MSHTKWNTKDKDTKFKTIPQSIKRACTYIAKAALVYRRIGLSMTNSVADHPSDQSEFQETIKLLGNQEGLYFIPLPWFWSGIDRVKSSTSTTHSLHIHLCKQNYCSTASPTNWIRTIWVVILIVTAHHHGNRLFLPWDTLGVQYWVNKYFVWQSTS